MSSEPLLQLSLSRSRPGPGLHRFALLCALSTACLIALGGLVTSHGAGLSVPDWPNSYGYNMFFFPVSQWMGGIFYEHTHRLLASLVGLETSILALWLFGRSARPLLRWAGALLWLLGLALALSRPGRWADGLVLGASGGAGFFCSFFWPRSEPAGRGLRRLGLAAFVAVLLQGVLGGLRVVLFKDQLGIIHAALAQLFFVMLCALALFTSRSWQGSAGRAELGPLLPLWLTASLLIGLQLILGATMRHQHAGLAIPDFPLAYGQLWPAMDADSLQRYNQQRLEVTALNGLTATQIGLQMLHRLLAAAIVLAVGLAAWGSRRALGPAHLCSKLTLAWLGLILVQALLGAATIWSAKAADIATAHVVVGALSLASGGLLSLLALRGRLAAGPPLPAGGVSLSGPPPAWTKRPSAAGIP